MNVERKESSMDDPTFNHHLLYRTPSTIRYTQDSPILPNVWLRFLSEPHKQHELIVSMRHNHGAANVAGELRQMLANYREKLERRETDASLALKDPIPNRLPPRVAYIAGQIAVSVYFDELLRVVLPHTKWWHDIYDDLRQLEHRDWEDALDASGEKYEFADYDHDDVYSHGPLSREELEKRTKWKRAHLKGFGVTAEWRLFPQPTREHEPDQWPICREADLTDALMILWEKFSDERSFPVDHREEFAGFESDDERLIRRRRYLLSIPFSLVWMVRAVGIIGSLFEQGPDSGTSSQLKDDLKEEFGSSDSDFEKALTLREGLVRQFTQLFLEWDRLSPDGGGQYTHERAIWQITTNREVTLAVHDSVKTVKADAAAQLFDISCAELTWAVIDSGIDAEHPAFRDTSEKQEKLSRRMLKVAGKGEEGLRVSDLPSRIVKTVDFTMLRSLLDCELNNYNNDPGAISALDRIQFQNSLAGRRKEFFDKVLDRSLHKRGPGGQSIAEREAAFNAKRRKRLSNSARATLAKILWDKRQAKLETLDVIKRITTDIYRRREIDWQILEPALVVEAPEPPTNSHGTHVAGILGADWIEDFRHERKLPLSTRTRKMRGVCPDIKIMDIRVFSDDGLTDEFELIAALQYLRWLNMRAGTMKVPGANISMSLVHEVRRHACGQTPICKECDEASANGMVVVAAAGNRGFEMSDSGIISADDHYKTVSITDPGNAETVITVGATHRKRPHEYGVSYFSSRGPTGDGRAKPDIVAPGEKIMAPVLLGRADAKDGTSMAAPHVSGVAALLMARHTELLGKPARVKSILCETATDLGRERYFQGYGLVDGLRAIQSL